MKLYLDLIFLLNWLFDFLLLLVVSVVLRRHTSIKRLIYGSLVGGASIFVLFLKINTMHLFFIKIIFSLLMVLVTFGYRDIRYTSRNLFYLYTASILLGGFLYFLNLEFSYRQEGLIFYYHGLSINWIVLLLFSPFILYIYIKQALNLKTNYSNYYVVDIYFKDGTKKKVNAFLDTGNNLVDPYQKRPIILINQQQVKSLYKNEDLLLVPYEGINNQGLLKCIAPQKVFISGIGMRHHLLLGIVDNKIKIDGIDCILHTKLLEDL